MSRITVEKDLCVQDGACVEVCPARAIALDAESYPEDVPASGCILCGHCVAVCPTHALHHAGLPEDAFLPAQNAWPAPAAMDAFLKERRSVREFQPQPVAREIMLELLDIARRAPTASNSQKLHWIVVDGREKVHALAEEIVNGGRVGRLHPTLLQRWDSGEDFVLRGASTVVVACAPEEYAWGKEDGAIALTYLELAAEARGLGVCWAGYLTRIAGLYEPVRKMLEVPEGYAVRGGLMLGEGMHAYGRIPPRKPLSAHWL
jgi:nitroreductase/NAD-dependent dihydropyrimidine dehydrogenase PreA subunit